MVEKTAEKDVKRLLNTLHPLERKVLPFLRPNIDLKSIINETGLKEVEVMRALQWLANKKAIDLKTDVEEIAELDKNGKQYLEKGLPEIRFLKVLKGEKTIEEIRKKANLTKDELSISLGILRKKAAIFISRDKELKVKLMDQGKRILQKESLEEQLMKKLPSKISDMEKEELYAYGELKKRKDIIKTSIIKNRKVILTDIGNELIKYKFEAEGIIDRLTSEMLKRKSWKDKKFRGYDVSINVPKTYGGRIHFVNQAIEYIRKIWLELGFEEMSGNLIQSSFWDFDTLFVPQDHPARDVQDTFFIKDPKFATLPKELVSKIKAVHENGADTGSKGWHTEWSEDIAKENLLRTHTTVLSAKTIANIKKIPSKFFSVGKVFRNETVDWKHIFELTQVEGIVVDENVNFKNLKGYLNEFFKKMGYKAARIRPGHFPYTEPSAEIEALHPIKNEWIELGGAGIFRPEVTKPLIGKEIPVLAWGLGMERIISDYFEIHDIRDLYKNDLKQLKEIKFWMR